MPQVEIQEKIDKLGSAFEQFKEANDKRLEEISKKGHADPLLEEKVKKANEDVGKINAELEELKTALNRRNTMAGVDEKTAYAHGEYKGIMPALFHEGKFQPEKDHEYKEAFLGYMRRGHEEKALSVGSDPDGGYLVRPVVSDRVIKKVFESSPVRALAAVQVITSDSLDIMTDLNEASSGWVAEVGSRTETNTPQIGRRSIPTHELYANPAATQKLLDDAGVDMEAWLAEKVADKFARDEATAFVSGNGVGKPRGFTTYASGTSDGQIEQVASGSSSAITADGLMNLFYALKAPYRGNATWGMERATLTDVRQLKGSDNNYLWQPGLSAGTPSTLLGRPVAEMDDMASVAGSALPIVVADFREAYQIVDRIGIRTLRDPYSNKPYVHFYTTKRVGGDVVNFEAIKLQVIST